MGNMTKPSPKVLQSTSGSVAQAKMRPAPAAKEIKTARAQVKQAKNYRVRGGDTLYRIALKHGTTVANLLAFNSLAAPAAIKPGDTLRIPAAR